MGYEGRPVLGKEERERVLGRVFAAGEFGVEVKKDAQACNYKRLFSSLYEMDINLQFAATAMALPAYEDEDLSRAVSAAYGKRERLLGEVITLLQASCGCKGGS